MIGRNIFAICLVACSFTSISLLCGDEAQLKFEALPDLPDQIGVAGPIVGVHNDVLIVAGGANFAEPESPDLWQVPKQYHRAIWVMKRNSSGNADQFEWIQFATAPELSRPVGYAAVVSTKHGVLCMGGETTSPTNRAFLLSWDSNRHTIIENDHSVPDLPVACTGGAAAIVGDYVYLVAGQQSFADGSRRASRTVWRLKLDILRAVESNDDINAESSHWEVIVSWPESGPPRMFPLICAQHDGFTDRLYVFGGRHFLPGKDRNDLRNLKFGSDCWSFDPRKFDSKKFEASTGAYSGDSPWKRVKDSPVPLSAGTAVALGPAHIIVPAYADGSVLARQMNSGKSMSEFGHPGFPRKAYAYHSITDTWIEYADIPSNQVTTPAVRWGNDIILVSGEIRPRVRTRSVWRIEPQTGATSFGSVNLAVVVLYLAAMVGIGVYFAKRNRSTDDFFRGGKGIPWWAAGCSIFATMLSSITYMAIPAKAFAQDWVYALGNVMILAVAPIAVFVALPFFRRIDATSAYEYLEKRFNRVARLIGSGSFSLFHIFRMGVVLALAALALASITPLHPAQCVLVMGILSIIYCALGGVEAVIWTDTVQTFVLLGGAVLCIICAWVGSDAGSFSAAQESQKLHLLNFDFDSVSFMTMAIWVVVLGGLGQNIASYTADQAVVQRYMTTQTQSDAARSIWLNGLMAIPAGLIFFGMGTAFWMFYQSHPEKLDPTISNDRIMPLFISQELPIGLAGLVVAGIFAAAQSTVSTSMNSGATTIVTDFLRPIAKEKNERFFLFAARLITVAMGILGTGAGLLFVEPSIKSLFDQFISILGMFLGVLAGLFALGALTRRANGAGSLVGAITSIFCMILIVFAARDQSLLGFSPRSLLDSMGTKVYMVNGYLYATIGISICFVVGYCASFCFRTESAKLDGLTVWNLKN